MVFIIQEELTKDYNKNRVIFQTTSSQFQRQKIEIGYQGMYLGIYKIDGRDVLSHSSATSSHFDKKLMKVSFKNGNYYLRSDGYTNFYRRLDPKKDFSIFPGHRISFGSNMLYLIQYVNIALHGARKSVIVKEYTSISQIANISVYALIESVGEDGSCREFVYDNILEKLGNSARFFGLDKSKKFFSTLGEVIYKTFDDLDMQFMHEFPKKRSKSGASVLMVLIIGNKIFCAGLGDMQAYLVRGSEIAKINYSHDLVRDQKNDIFQLFSASSYFL